MQPIGWLSGLLLVIPNILQKTTWFLIPQRGTLHWAFWRWITAQLGWSRLTWNNFGLTLHIALSRFVRFLEKQKPGNWHWTLNANMLSPVCKGDRSLYERGNHWSTIFDWPGWVLPCELLPFWCRWWNPSAFVPRCLPRAHLFLEGFLTVQWATCIDSMVQPLDAQLCYMYKYGGASFFLDIPTWGGIIQQKSTSKFLSSSGCALQCGEPSASPTAMVQSGSGGRGCWWAVPGTGPVPFVKLRKAMDVEAIYWDWTRECTQTITCTLVPSRP